MAKSSTQFVCQHCGWISPKWVGQCGQCQEWNTLVETQVITSVGEKKHAVHLSPDLIVPFNQVNQNIIAIHRISSGVSEFDRVLGGSYQGQDENGQERKSDYQQKHDHRDQEGTREGKREVQGMVPGAVMLVGGEPGIGKSTLLTQVALHIAGSLEPEHTSKNAKEGTDGPVKSPPSVLYVCGEESPSQISLRIRRLQEEKAYREKEEYAQTGKKESSQSSSQARFSPEGIHFITTTDVDQIIALVETHKPRLLIVDSIQTLSTTDLTGGAGSFGQMRECTERLSQTVKRLHVPTFLIGHVTKEGSIAGPKIIEHIVDTVLELMGERTGELRLLRTIKNRFGATDEVGIFRMTQFGLEEVSNPNQLFLEHPTPTPGSALACILEGTRPFLIEVQALVVDSHLPTPRRVGRGVELSRIQVLCAVLEKHCRVPLGTMDVFVNVAGGFVVKEPAIDLSLALALLSSVKNKPLPKGLIAIGEVGLLGEIRPVSFLEQRLREVKRLGYTTVVSQKTYPSLPALLQKLQLF